MNAHDQPPILLPPTPLRTSSDYVARGGGEGLATARRVGPGQTIQTVLAAHLRGRGGAGFPTGLKWSVVAESGENQRRFVVCNAAEGEPGTFKDRALIRANPYQILEGLAIAAFAVDAEAAYVGIKEAYELEIGLLAGAADELRTAGILEDLPVHIVAGPDDYLLGEEKALLETLDGRDPLPRWLPPYVMGLETGAVPGVGAGTVGAEEAFNPTVVNNVETLANVPHILRNGADWFRSIGTETSPGTMVFTVTGDVSRQAVAELPMGTPLSYLVYGPGGGPQPGRSVKAVFPGVSNSPLPSSLLETPMDFDSMRSVGSGLGSGGMIVYDDSACLVAVAATLSRFLAFESCGQCPPCKLGTRTISDLFSKLEEGSADDHVMSEISAWAGHVVDANRCGLGQGQRALATGVLHHFEEELRSHIGSPCTSERSIDVPKIIDLDADQVSYDVSYFRWRRP